MTRKRYSPEQIIVKLREAEIIESKGLTQVEAAKKLGICEQTLIRWRKEYGGLRVDQARRFKLLPFFAFVLRNFLPVECVDF